jgi:hypothetical protein
MDTNHNDRYYYIIEHVGASIEERWMNKSGYGEFDTASRFKSYTGAYAVAAASDLNCRIHYYDPITEDLEVASSSYIYDALPKR